MVTVIIIFNLVDYHLIYWAHSKRRTFLTFPTFYNSHTTFLVQVMYYNEVVQLMYYHGLLEYPDVQLPFDAKYRPGGYY